MRRALLCASQRIEKFRPCDGACCKNSPLRMVMRAGERDCFFRDPNGKRDVNSACRIMEDRRLIQLLTEAEGKRFIEACIGYPQIYPSPMMGEKDPRICCWRNV